MRRVIICALFLAAPVGCSREQPPPADVVSCPTETMDVLFAGADPPNPFEESPAAPACALLEHDVLIILGCPSNEDGTPSICQTRRADIAVALSAAGYGHRFIVTGAAAHNAYVEADALAALLIDRGVPDADIRREPQAFHTDENLYFSTGIMEAEGWISAVVVSDASGHLLFNAICDSNCCVHLGRLTIFEYPILTPFDDKMTVKAGHYVRHPQAPAVSETECAQIEMPSKLMCLNLETRRACAGDLKL